MLLRECDRNLGEQGLLDVIDIDAVDDGQSLLVSKGVQDFVRVQVPVVDEHVHESFIALELPRMIRHDLLFALQLSNLENHQNYPY